jgi:Na+/H+ antiporter NhaD/arsenite permease-like protein
MTSPEVSTVSETHEDGAGSVQHHGGGKLGAGTWAAIAIGAVIMALLVYNHLTSDHGPGHAEHADVDTAQPDVEHAADAAHEAVAEHADMHAADSEHADADAKAHPPLWACLPFAALLLCIAILPLLHATRHWWESNRNRLIVALVFGAFALLYYLVTAGTGKVVYTLDHAVCGEYIPFIVLLFSLYVISGGISLRGDLRAHPRTNTAFIVVGGLLASFVGTTGAAMLLIRPLLQTNSERRHVTHTVIFFIFVVCNCGGCLLPIGDPPLFLGYLRGVPFLWTFQLVVPWAVTCGAIVAIYYFWDTIAYRREETRDIILDQTQRTPLSLKGLINLVWLFGVVLCVALISDKKPFPFTDWYPFPFLRELVMFVLVGLSLVTTPAGIREANKFNYHAILEVAALFIGIFITMQIPIEILNVKGSELGLKVPWHFFWATGSLSSFLDNAPTYVVFFETAKTLPAGAEFLKLPNSQYINEPLLIGISLGAVFMGAMTYIGNGPNFMVKSIAEQAGIRMPSFFGYMIYSVLILVPLFVVVTIIFV